MTIPTHSAVYDTIIPEWYEVEHQASHCLRCHITYHISVTFAVNTFMVGKAKTLNKRPISEIRWNRPVHVRMGKPINTPLCHVCGSQPNILSHLPTPAPTTTPPPSWLKNKEEPKPKSKPKAPTEPKKKKTIIDADYFDV